MSNRWLIWQIVDSAFPSGGFAHSGGLEAACQYGVVTDSISLAEWIRATMRQMHRGVLGFVERACLEHQAFMNIDGDCDLFLNNHVTNRASRAQGRAFLATAAGVFRKSAIRDLNQLVREQKFPGHLAPVFGVVSHHLGIEKACTTSLFTFMLLRSQISVAVRLGIIGPLEGQRLQAEFSTEFQEITDCKTDAEPVQISPFMDLIQGTQDRLYSRLFQS